MKKEKRIIADFLARNHDFDFSKFADPFLEDILRKRTAETSCDSVAAYADLLQHDVAEASVFLDFLQINYSEFFRNSLTFAVLENILLPQMTSVNPGERQKEIRIWSAACASGQEAYSLAILLEELKAGRSKTFNYRIFATDQNEANIEEARKGMYSGSALNGLNLKRLNQYFTRLDKVYQVKQKLKDKIEFTTFDLFNGQYSSPPSSIFGGFDIVICANLLFYYKPEFQDQIIQKVGKGMLDQGYLVTGEAERGILLKHNYHEVIPFSSIFQKNSRDEKF